MATDALSIAALDAIAAVVRTVRKADGWRTDLGAAVSVEDDYATTLSQAKVATFIGADDMPPGEATRTQRQRTLNFVAEFSLPSSFAGAHRLAHNGLADLLDVLPRASGVVAGVSKVVLDGSRILRRPEGFPGVVAQVTAHVTLTERIPAPPPED